MEHARAFLDEVRTLAGRDPRGALRLLERKAAAYRDAFGLSGPLHDPFRALVSDVRRRLDARRSTAPELTVQTVPWESLTDLGSLVEVAGQVTADVVYLGPPDPRRDAAPLTQVDALNEFGDPKVVMVVVGEGPPMLFRASFLQSAVASINPKTDIADAGQDLLELAERSGYAVRWLR